MSLAELIRSVAHKAQSPGNHSQVTPVTPLKNTVLPLQPAPQAEVTPVTPVTPEKTNVRDKTEAQNDDADLRMSWLVLMDGKPARVVGTRKRSYAEVLRSVQSRWPEYNVEVVK